MATLFLSKRLTLESPDAIIRKLEDDGEYAISVDIPLDDDDEDAICELLFTKEEVAEMYDVLFN